MIIFLIKPLTKHTFFTLLMRCGSIHIRFLETILFYYIKSYFINYTISFYNASNIPTFIYLIYSLIY